jgi:hypothetical protein
VHRAANLRAIVDDLRDQGITSVRTIVAELNERCVLTPRGGAWHACCRECKSDGRSTLLAKRQRVPFRATICQKRPRPYYFGNSDLKLAAAEQASEHFRFHARSQKCQEWSAAPSANVTVVFVVATSPLKGDFANEPLCTPVKTRFPL